MNNRAELEQAAADILAVLDAKMAPLNFPEWRAWRAMRRALDAMQDDPTPVLATAGAVIMNMSPVNRRRRLGKRSYGEIGLAAIRAAGMPLKTDKMLAAVAAEYGNEILDRKGTVQAAFSKDKRLVSIEWDDARAWWSADLPAPPPGTITIPDI